MVARFKKRVNFLLAMFYTAIFFMTIAFLIGVAVNCLWHHPEPYCFGYWFAPTAVFSILLFYAALLCLSWEMIVEQDGEQFNLTKRYALAKRVFFEKTYPDIDSIYWKEDVGDTDSSLNLFVTFPDGKAKQIINVADALVFWASRSEIIRFRDEVYDEIVKARYVKN